MAGRFQDIRQGRRSHMAMGSVFGATLAISLATAMPSTAGDYAADQAIRNELGTILDGAIRQHGGREISITRAWGYLHPDKSLLFCGAGFSDSGVTTFVVFMDGKEDDVVDVGTPLDVMREVGCGATGFHTIRGTSTPNHPLAGIHPDPLPSPPRDTSRIPKDAFGNILVTAEDKADPRCSVATAYAYRVFVEHERGVIQSSGEPVASFNDYTQPFARCFNRFGQAVMQGMLGRMNAASDRLWLENEMTSLRLRYGRR